MSDIRFNQWLHQSGTGGVSQVDGGHVGIGTTNPDIAVHTANAKKLNVGIVTANSIYAGNFYGNGSNLSGLAADKIIEGDTKVEVVDSGSQYIVGEVNGSEKFRIDSTGRVLIGTTIQGTAGADKLTLSTGGSTGITIRSGSSNDGNLYFAMGTTGNETYRGFIQYEHSNNAFRFGTNASERLRIDSSGKIGINNNSPSARVSVKDTTAFTTYANVTPSSTQSMLQLWNNPSSEAVGHHATIQFAINGGSQNRVNTISAVAETNNSRHTAFTFCTDEGSGRTEKVRITSTGNFGIGTNSPTDKLHVVGTTNFVSNSYIGGDLYMYGNSYGNGIFLGGSNALHKLDYYKTGQWVPEVIDANGSNYSISYTAGECRWVRIGHLVYAYYNIQNQENGSKTGNLVLRGWPFTCKAFQVQGHFWVDHSSPSSGLGDIVGGTHRLTDTSGNNTAYWVKPTDKSGMGYASSRYLQHGQWSYGRWIYGSFMYEIT